MMHQRLTFLACAAGAAAALTLAAMLPTAQAAPGYSEVDDGARQALVVSDGGLDATPAPEDGSALGRLADATVMAEALLEAGLDSPLSEAGPQPVLGNASVRTAEATADTADADASVLRPLPSPSMNTQVPGLSESDLLRYKRQMLRKDI